MEPFQGVGPVAEYLRELGEIVADLTDRVASLEMRSVTRSEMTGLTETIEAVGGLMATIRDRMADDDESVALAPQVTACSG